MARNEDNANKNKGGSKGGKGNHQPGQTMRGGGGALREGAKETNPDPHLEGRTKGKGSAHQSGDKPPKTPD